VQGSLKEFSTFYRVEGREYLLLTGSGLEDLLEGLFLFYRGLRGKRGFSLFYRPRGGEIALTLTGSSGNLVKGRKACFKD
jgi:hypothetical protein